MKRRGNPEGLRAGADKREITTHNALVDAYKRLERGEPTVVNRKSPITASNVAKEAGVDRSALYINHRDILEKIQQTKIERKAGLEGRRRRGHVKDAEARIEELREMIAELQKEKADIATALASEHYQRVQLQDKLDSVTAERDDLMQRLAKVIPLRTVPDLSTTGGGHESNT
jgi:chromosome segregation ATPase